MYTDGQRSTCQAVLDKALSRESKKERVNKEKYDKVYSEVENYFNEGLSLEDIIASQPTSKYDKIYYDYTNRKPKDFVTHVYQSLTKK